MHTPLRGCFDESSQPVSPSGGDKGLSLVGRLHVAFERGEQVDLGVLFELLLPFQI